MGFSTPIASAADDVSHWRVPGDDDQGQEARRALYAHSLAGSDDDDDDEEPLTRAVAAGIDARRKVWHLSLFTSRVF